jgi:DNA-binding beta-propeller fold protein YncE
MLAVALCPLLVIPPAASARIGALHQLKGKAGCFVQQSAPRALKRDCGVGRFGGGQMWALALSPDARNLYVASLHGAVSVLSIKHGRLHQLPGTSGCLSRTGKFGCGRVPQLFGGRDIAVSPDGRTVYVGSVDDSRTAGRVVIFTRDRRTGALRNAGCVGGKGGACTSVRGLFGAVTKLLVSRDGRTVYVASGGVGAFGATRGGVAVFDRGQGGKLSQLAGAAGCLSLDGSDGCTAARELLPQCCSLAISPDSRNVYAGSSAVSEVGGTEVASFGLAAFSRDPAGGALTQLPGSSGCVNQDGSNGCAPAAFNGGGPNNEAGDLVISPNGRDVYLSHESISEGAEAAICGAASDFLALFRRDPNVGALGPLPVDRGTCGGSAVAISPDGGSVYTLAGSFVDLVSAYARNRQTGLLTESGCVGPFRHTCGPTRHFDSPTAMALTRRFAYIIADSPVEGSVLGVFSRSVR